eukprot:scaffold340763_cov189-Cyclotella_meneghiniana.AAC.1
MCCGIDGGRGLDRKGLALKQPIGRALICRAINPLWGPFKYGRDTEESIDTIKDMEENGSLT